MKVEKLMYFVLGLTAIILMALIFWLIFFNDTKVAEATSNNITICHKNNGNGWSKISVDPNAINGLGNGDHNDSGHQNGQDIIPPGYWDWNGRNWNTQGQAIYNNNCNVPVTPSITPRPSVQPTVTPTVSPTPTKEPECEDECEPSVTPEPTVTPEPEVTPEPVVTTQNVTGGESATDNSCHEQNTTKVGANFHVYRKGGDAIVKWFPTEGNRAHIYYVNINNLNDSHALLNVENDGYEDNLHDLGSKDWRFGLQQVNGCSGGPIVWVDDGPSDGWKLFR